MINDKILGKTLRREFKQLLFFVILLFTSACSRYKAQTSAQIIISGLTSGQNNDLVLNGFSEDGEYFSKHLKGSQKPSPIEIPVGKWNFYGFYWEDRTAYCTWNSSELLGATEKIDLTFSKENCFHERFSHPTYRKNNSTTSRLPLWVYPCAKYTKDKQGIIINSAESFEDHCSTDINYESIKVTYPEVSISSVDSPSFNYDSVVTECVDISENENPKRIFVPVGSSIPFHMDLMFYSDNNCADEIGRVKTNRLMHDSNKGHYFIFDDPEEGKINLIALMLDESTIHEGEEGQQNDSHQITLTNDLEVTFETMPTFTITGLSPNDTVTLFTSENNCRSGLEPLSEGTTLTEDLDITLGDGMELGAHEIFAKSTSESGEVSSCFSTTYTISDPANICANSVHDAMYETSTDCGGLCAKKEGTYQCNFGVSCTENTDCGSGYCDSGSKTCSNFSLSFNGTSNYVYFSGTDAPNINGTYTEEPSLDTSTVTDFTISMWFKSNDMTQKQWLLGQRDSSDFIWDGQFKIQLNSSGAFDISTWHYNYSRAGSIRDKEFGYADGRLEESKWYHFTYTVADIDNTPTQSIYINGDLVNTKNLSPGDIALTEKLKVYLGAEGRHVLLDCCGFNYFDGQMDDVAIWKVALDGEAVSSIYKNGHPFDLRLPSQGYSESHINHLYAYYRFNKGEGNNVYDLSNNEFDGIINDGNNSSWAANVNIHNELGGTSSLIGEAPGSLCLENNDCSTFNCHGGTCQSSTLFAYCQSDQDCSEGKCDTGLKLCLASPAGAKCIGNSDCFSGNCDNGLCAEGSHLSSCDITNYGRDCAAGLSCQLTLTNNVAIHGANSYDYLVYQCLKNPLFDSCSENGDCESNHCLNNTCYAKSTGASCTSNAECFSNDCDIGGSNQCAIPALGSTSICSNDSDCNGRKCVNNLCEDVTASSCWNGVWDENYETDFNCGKECSFIDAKLQCQVGQACTRDRDCASGTCVDSTCIDKALNISDSYIYFDLDQTGNRVSPLGGVAESNSPAIDDPDGEVNWSINIWIKTEKLDYQTIVSQLEDTADKSEKAFSLKLESNDLYFKYKFNSTPTVYDCDPGVTVSDNEWHMITLTKRKQAGIPDKGVFNVYLDGVNCLTNQEIADNAGAVSNLNKIYIGRDVAHAPAFAHQFVGEMDNLTFWNTEISSTEIDQLYHGGKPTNPLINFHSYKSAYYVTNHYNMNEVDSSSSELIYDTGPYSENGYAFFEGENSDTNKANYFEYEELETPGGRVKTIKLKGLCQTMLDDIESDLYISSDDRSFDDLSIQNTPSDLDTYTLNQDGLELKFSDHETYSTRLIIGDDSHYYVYDVVNDYYDPTKEFIIVDSTATGTQSGAGGTRCNLRDAVNSWNNPGSQYGTCNTLDNQTTPTAIIFETTSTTTTYELHQTNTDDNNNNSSGDYDFICDTPDPGCEPLEILGCGDYTNDPENFTKLFVPIATRNSRFFDIHSDTILEVSDVTLDNGKAHDGLGGAIKNKGTLTLENVTLSNNIAKGPDAESTGDFYGGGGGGASAMGGAIFNEGVLYINENVDFSSNQAIGGDGGDGGEQTCGTASVCIGFDQGVGGAGATLSTNNGYAAMEDFFDEMGNLIDSVEVVYPPWKENFLINSGGHGGYAHLMDGSQGTTGGLGGGTGGAGLVDGGLAAEAGLFRAGGGGNSAWNVVTGHSGGGGGGGAFGAAIFNNSNGEVHLIESNYPTFNNNTLTEGVGGNSGNPSWEGSDADLQGVGTLGTPENLFNYNGDVLLDNGDNFDFNPSGSGNNLKFYDYLCGAGHPVTCTCSKGTCSD